MTWPTVAQVKTYLGVTASDRDAVILQALQAACEQVGTDVGYRDITIDEESGDPGFILSGVLGPLTDQDPEPEPVEIVPTPSLAQAALILAVMAVKAPDAPFGVAAVFDTGGLRVAAEHPTYLRMLTGQVQAFGIG